MSSDYEWSRGAAHNLQHRSAGQVVMNAVIGKINSTEKRLRIFVKLCLTKRPWRLHLNSR